LPPYAAAIVLYGIVRHIFVERQMARLAWYYDLFLQNYLGVHGFGPSWSLCVEEHFYLLLPLAVLTVERCLGRRAFRYVLPAAFFVPTLLRGMTLLHDGTLPADWYWMTHFHCEGLIAGVWLAYLYVDEPATFSALKRPATWLLPVAPIVLFVLPLWTSRTLAVNMFVFTVLALGYAAWLRVLYDLKWDPRSLVGRCVQHAVRGLALCSYSIYLTHTTLFEPLREWTGAWPRGMLRTSAVLAGALFGGIVFYLLIERTAILTRDRFLRSNQSQNPRVELSHRHAPV
jgi:peptidoglycan/LPS O-acetylase OafA/YrhL